MLIFSIFGLILNLLVVYILLIRIRILKIDTILSNLITVLDIASALSLITRIIWKWSTAGNDSLYNNEIFCKASGTIFFASTLSSFDIVSVLGVIRCLIIVFKLKFKSIYWSALLTIILCYNWLGAIFLNWNFSEISWGNFCKYQEGLENIGGSFGPIISIKAVIMVIIVCLSYTLIFRFYGIYYDKMKRSSSQSDCNLLNEIKTQKSITSLKLLGLIFSYILIYLPKITIFILYNFKVWGHYSEWEVITSVLLSMSSLINASVILFIQEETKHEWQVLTTILFHRVKSIY